MKGELGVLVQIEWYTASAAMVLHIKTYLDVKY